MLMLFLFLKHLHFCPNVFRHVGKGLEKKTKVNFKIYDVTECTTNNYNPHCPISQKVKLTRQ